MSDKLCGLCQKNNGKYVCPTCSVFYCSVVCYKSQQHLQCSEIFYKKCVEEELRSQKCTPSNEIISALKRTENNFSHEQLGGTEDEDDDDDEEDEEDEEDEDEDEDEDENENDSDDDDSIARRMKNVDLNDSDVLWEKLTVEERKEFLTMVSNGKIRKILPEWTPWWKSFKKKLIIDIESENESNTEDSECPNVDVSIPPLSEITKRTPSKNITFMIVNILCAYTYTARWFKGKHCDMPVEGVTTLFALSAVLRSNKVIESLVEAFSEFENDLENCQWLTQESDALKLVSEDLRDIVNGSKGQDLYFSIKASLCDIRVMLDEALKILRDPTGPKCFTGPKPTLMHLKMQSKKMLYYLSWITSPGQLFQINL